MPTYEYECEGCGHRFERFQSILDPPLKRCPECRRKVRRLIGTGAGILFKGSGFYETDYRSSSYEAGKKKEQSESKTESTPAKKPESGKADKSPAKKDG
jgi:putative FmdB family regulatory protein